MTCTDPLPLEVVAVIVTTTLAALLDPIVPMPPEDIEITLELLELQVAELVTSVPP